MMSGSVLSSCLVMHCSRCSIPHLAFSRSSSALLGAVWAGRVTEDIASVCCLCAAREPVDAAAWHTCPDTASAPAPAAGPAPAAPDAGASLDVAAATAAAGAVPAAVLTL